MQTGNMSINNNSYIFLFFIIILLLFISFLFHFLSYTFPYFSRLFLSSSFLYFSPFIVFLSFFFHYFSFSVLSRYCSFCFLLSSTTFPRSSIPDSRSMLMTAISCLSSKSNNRDKNQTGS